MPITRLEYIRKKNGLTQNEIARLLNVSVSYYEKIERGTCKAGAGFIRNFKAVFPFEDINIFFEG